MHILGWHMERMTRGRVSGFVKKEGIFVSLKHMFLD